ncbi:hypothetical protein CBER1_05643 [Cercospora berteroae]|uniref:Zn(2)-C6 fungal-type domain-containing protein n=1 Tax=Cercospora berteroae TaxID=357750 RepID=A0A2S6C5H4_9PEZI|nr:hypothetical protein CBER1_05643 [Cercospora berteroae]
MLFQSDLSGVNGPAANVPPTTVETGLVPSYRRNGKLFSCEPCRRGKLRCDHSTPICGRCARRGKESECVYHPAPLTKPRMSSGAGPLRTSNPSRTLPQVPYPTERLDTQRSHALASPPSSTNTTSGQEEALLHVNGTSLGQSPIVRSPLVQMVSPATGSSRLSSRDSHRSPASAMSFRDSKTGYLGATSYSAVYEENSSILQTPEVDEARDLPVTSAEKIQQGAQILSMLKDLPVYREYMGRWFELCDGLVIMQPIFKIWIDELWTGFGDVLAEGKTEQLLALSELVWINTRQSMKVHGDMTAREWSKSASGQHLRWEVVGIILSLVGLIAVNLSNWDTIFDSVQESYVDRATFADRMRKASEFCLCFCYECEVLNDIYLCFMYEDLILVECIKGDAHYAAWQRTGEVCDAVVAMGLHQGNKPDAHTPFFLSELRKKIFISAFGHDKTIATFLGRPPRLSHRYCKMESPLDLSDEEVVSEGADLQAALSQLDENGWNTSGHLHRNTWLRVWFKQASLREEILEIALGTDEEDIAQQTEQVRVKMERLHKSLPDFMCITPEQVLSEGNTYLGMGFPVNRVKDATRLVHFCIHTGLAHTEFLLQRAMVSRLRTDTKKLIPIARRMLKMVLLAQSKKEFFRDFQGDLIYLLALHGLPAAGVLAVELLTQERTRQWTPDLLPRSETIQDLSVFISALSAVGPGEGNFFICDQGRRALSRVLDQILSPNPLPSSAPATGEAAVYDDSSSTYFPIGNDAEFLQWLEHVEWDKNTWIEPLPASNLEAP